MSKLNEWSAENLERAAKHMRELDKSVNAKAAMELAKREQDVLMAQSTADSKKHEAMKEQYRAEAERVRWEEQRKTMDHKRENEKAMVDYKVQRERESLEEADRLARRRDEDNRRKALEDERTKAAIRRQAEEELQAERRRTDEHRAKLERENMKARAIAEAEGRIKEQRDNEDVYTRQLKVRMGEERETRLEAIAATWKNVQATMNDFLSDPGKIAAVVLGITAAAGGVYGMRETARVVSRLVEKRLGTPSLVRETSRMTNHFALRTRLLRAVGLKRPEEGHSLSDVVLRSDVADRVGRVSVAVRNTRANGAPYRHMLFYGPPGTGKTMVAKRLARSSGMDYAIMSGGDVGPLGRDAVTELHKLFDWAQTSRRGLLVFIDEADAFLASRSKTNMSEEQRNALNALLFRTGEASKQFMMVLATNRPGDLDRALVDRVDEAMVFDLPDLEARKKLHKQYYNKYITDAGKEAKGGPLGLFSRSSAHITVQGVSDSDIDAIAVRTEGFSGREISKLWITVQADVYGRATPVLTKAILDENVQVKMREHRAKQEFGESHHDYVAHASGSGAGGASAAATRAVRGALAAESGVLQ